MCPTQVTHYNLMCIHYTVTFGDEQRAVEDQSLFCHETDFVNRH